MNDEHGFDHSFGYQVGKSQEMQANQGFWQAFVISRQPAKTRCPTKTALDYPAAGQQDKAFLHIRVTSRATRSPSVSTAMWVLEPFNSRAEANARKGDYDKSINK